MTKNTMTYEDALRAEPDGRTQEEIFESIVEDIKKKYNGNITHGEACEAARNYIGFVKKILEIHARNAQCA